MQEALRVLGAAYTLKGSGVAHTQLQAYASLVVRLSHPEIWMTTNVCHCSLMVAYCVPLLTCACVLMAHNDLPIFHGSHLMHLLMPALALSISSTDF